MMERQLLSVYFILGSNDTEEDPLYILEQALQGGITLFQFREKGSDALNSEAKKQLAKQMKKLCHVYQVPFFVNDDVDLAVEIGADGVHVGQDDMPISEVRKQVPKGCFIGVSATNVQEAVQAKADGADYIGVGPIYSTNTKSDAKEPIGTAGLQAIREQVGETPIVAIGGIDLPSVHAVMRAGADGVSIISAISRATNSKHAAASFLADVNDFHQ
ncbi:thiamine phosphate synthase [Gracilibacillus sp. S3-1-1]|uniref:Thiamine phosphate synthase n=1 Tax=Gracilibacillus pellucidus TaxID=3095368 RepID=A0ACC6M5X6_9BACI|nr:thiamine phosphate synthase [Gracilibacillus sp. S3-1-1]MDX8046354.1 thiamine phosphate synthase [Gracilibacillus sp. S3-1-1]